MIPVASIVLFVCVYSIVVIGQSIPFQFDSTYLPEICEQTAQPTDHILLEFDIIAANGTSFANVKLPNQLFHTVLGEGVS